MTAILGISAGVRTTALVIIQNREILDIIIRDTKGLWDHCKGVIVNLVETAIEKYQVQAIAMKVCPSPHITEALATLYDDISRLAHNTGIFLSVFDMETLRKRSPGNPTNALTLFSHLVRLFPELEAQYHKVHLNRNRRMFEALACVLVE